MLACWAMACSSSGSGVVVAQGGASASGGASAGASNLGGSGSGGANGAGGGIGSGGANGGSVAGASGGSNTSAAGGTSSGTSGTSGGAASGGASTTGGVSGAASSGGALGAGGTPGTTGGAAGAAGTAGSGGSGGLPPETCTATAVSVTQSGTKYTFDNGFIRTTVNVADATVPSFIVSGVETMTSGGYFSWGTNVYTAGPFTGSLVADPAKNNGELAEVAMTTKWDQSTGKIPLDIQVRFALPRCSHGLYQYVVLTHPTQYPAFTPGELRVNHYVQWDEVFDWYAVDDQRRGVFTSKAAAAAATAVTGAPQEVLKYSSGPFADRPGWQKYDNSLEWGEGTVYGWSSSKKSIGLWMINPANEYLPGGPLKTELTIHDAGSKATFLNYWGGTHFYGALEGVKAGEFREKALGPWLVYGNATKTTGTAGQDELWADAKQRLIRERAAWPYVWETDTKYPPKSARGSVQGRLSYQDAEQPTASVASAWVGLADPPVSGAANFEHQAWNYQYWVHADAQGNFSIPNVRPGAYTLHAFVRGIHGVYIGKASGVTISAANTTNLGTVAWLPDRLGPNVWEIGVPDRTPAEFFRGNQPWRYGVSKAFTTDFPSGINYSVGSSDWSKHWNYMQPGGSWNVQFNLASVPTNVSGASLVLDVAGSDGITLTATVNATKVGTCSMPFDDGSIDRDQPHGAFRSCRIAVPLTQLKTGANQLAIASSSNLMWDYVRLEWVTK
ncbi:MAG: polysaccharide lyase family protein [Polyangiaceae bacterium]